VAGVGAGTYISFVIYFNCRRQLTYKHPIRTPDRRILMHLRGTGKRLPAPTPHKRAEQSERGTRVKWRREGAAGEMEKGGVK